MEETQYFEFLSSNTRATKSQITQLTDSCVVSTSVHDGGDCKHTMPKRSHTVWMRIEQNADKQKQNKVRKSRKTMRPYDGRNSVVHRLFDSFDSLQRRRHGNHVRMIFLTCLFARIIGW
jgi:hypothetical protein